MTEEQLQQVQEEEARRAELEALPAITFAEYDAAIRKWMLLSDPGIVKLLPALYVANCLKDRDPVWMMVIGPSGGGKTELLGMMLDMPFMYPVSLLTPNTFLSGFPGTKDASLLPKVSGKIMQFKDWTSILSMNKDARNEIMGQLREIFDGSLKKPFGNGKVAEWKGKVGIIAGCTPAVDLAMQMQASLGERFIQYRIAMPDRLEVARRCMDNTKDAKIMRIEMKNAFFAFMKSVQTETVTEELPEEVKEKIIHVANVATLARSGIIRDLGFKKEVVYVPSPEMPTRIVQQLTTIGTSLMIVNGGKYEPADMDILTKIAMDSIPQTNRMVMEAVAKKTWQTTSDIAVSVGYPTSPIHMYLENLAMLGVVKRIRAKDAGEGMGSGDRWEMGTDFVKVMYEAMGYVSASYQPPAIEEEKEVLVEQAFAETI